MILVDSSVWIAHLRGSWTVATAKLEAASGREPILVGDLILLEVLQGAGDEAHATRIERSLRRFDVVPLLDGDLAPLSRPELPQAEGPRLTIRKLIREHGTAALYITHDLAVVAQIADRIMVLRRGKCSNSAISRQILLEPKEDYTRRLVTERVAGRNFVAANVVAEVPILAISTTLAPIIRANPKSSTISQQARYPSLDEDRAKGVIRDVEHAFSKDGGLAVRLATSRSTGRS